MGSKLATIFTSHQLVRARELLALAQEASPFTISKRCSLKEAKDDLCQRMADLATEMRFIERGEDGFNSSHSDLLCCISTLYKEIVAKEDQARSLVMTATLERVAGCAQKFGRL
jgi:hypothetical protein